MFEIYYYCYYYYYPVEDIDIIEFSSDPTLYEPNRDPKKTSGHVEKTIEIKDTNNF